jgi:hypothetical protein
MEVSRRFMTSSNPKEAGRISSTRRARIPLIWCTNKTSESDDSQISYIKVTAKSQ